MNTTSHFIWNPSEGIDLGFFMIRYYSLMFAVAFGLGWYLMKAVFDREKESIEKLDTLFVYTVLATLLGARLGHVFFYQWEYFKNHPWEILLPFRFEPNFEFTGYSGLASHGATVSIIIFMYFYSKKVIQKPQFWILDRIVIPCAIGAAFVRIGNFFNSEIVGNVTQSPFGIRFVRDYFSKADAVNITKMSNPNEAFHAIATNPKYASFLEQVPAKHPTQLYEAFCYIFVFAVLYFLYWKTNARNKQGFLFGLFLIMLFTVRFFVEFLKESQGGFESALGVFSTGQWLSIPFIIIGIYFVVVSHKKVI